MDFIIGKKFYINNREEQTFLNTKNANLNSSHVHEMVHFKPLTPNDPQSGRTAPLTSKRFILYIYSTNIGTEYFKHGIYSPLFPLQNSVCFIILTYSVPVLFTFYIFIQQIQVLNILNTVYTLRLFLFKIQFVL